MKRAIVVPLALILLMVLIGPSFALSDYQRGILEGLNRGWSMAQRYNQANAGNSTSYNQAVPEYNAWIESVFGKNETLLLKTIAPGASRTYSISRTYMPVHSIDASWNRTESLLPEIDAYGYINGYPAEVYYSVGPALEDF